MSLAEYDDDIADEMVLRVGQVDRVSQVGRVGQVGQVDRVDRVGVRAAKASAAHSPGSGAPDSETAPKWLGGLFWRAVAGVRVPGPR